ncbi:MAG: hypothetical protein SGI96_16720 [Bacteroidota bacterium]|nr:hypothetical protein [Bacteroidota bacterium]
MHTINFTLKQHTPIIHFQHDQDGATLRATEVKPKLDRYIWEEWKKEEGGLEIAFDKYKYLLVGYNPNKEESLKKKFLDDKYRALDYSIKLIASENKRPSSHRIISENTNGVFYNIINIHILTHYKHLSNCIPLFIKNFFITHSFGKRQNKGYGSFYLSDTTVSEVKSVLKTYAGSIVFESIVDVSFEQTISDAWRRLKSGQNRPYEKSRIFKYASKHKMSWEKRYMKIKLIELIDSSGGALPDLQYRHEPLDCSNNEDTLIYNGFDDNPALVRTNPDDFAYFFVRCLLGLPEIYEFRTRSDAIYQYKVSSDTVERFKAPVTFKVFENNIFSYAESFNNNITDTDFSFELFIKDPIIRSLRTTINLRTPINFTFHQFLKDYFPSVGFALIP